MKQRFDLLDICILNVVDPRRPFSRHSVWQRSEPNKIGLFQSGKGNDYPVLILCEELNSIDNFVPCNSKIGPVEMTDLLALWLNDKVTNMYLELEVPETQLADWRSANRRWTYVSLFSSAMRLE